MPEILLTLGTYSILLGLLLLLLNMAYDKAVLWSLSSSNKLDDTLLPLGRKVGKLLVWVVYLTGVLHHLGVDMTPIWALCGAATLAISLALKGICTEIISMCQILGADTITLDSSVSIGNHEGRVLSIGLTAVTLLENNNTVVIPNSTVVKSIVKVKT